MSRVIKSNFTNTTIDEKRIIALQKIKTSLNNQENIEVDFTKFHLEAEAIIQEAQRKAEHLLSSAKLDLEKTLEEIENQKLKWDSEKQELQALAKKEGYSYGLAEGKQEGLDEYKTLIAEAREIIDISKQEYSTLINSSEETILKIGLKVAKKIITKELNDNNEDFLLIVRKAIKEVSEYTQIQIQVHPRYFELLLNQKEELRNLFNKETELSIYPNEELQETGCVIESSFGRIDASVDSQLIEIKHKLLSLLVGE
ncbi:flagellar assembly protein FliH [Bacillus luteolus]|uniref:Flagellar assembly protein FliH n=1 Tax=Litchfieldia luteola TaxID=682179 RepID=A0ABR9QJQ6_9BACI|nr:flagellar assembly protein FliH [Cytobacillus luteolus]MBP1941589.1 flagellar assembly protein FliH [Cytobacillus luteolus]